MKKKKLKRIFPIALLFAAALYSCDNGNATKTDKEKTAVKDTSSNSLVGLVATNTITEMLCQNWENKGDIDDNILSGGADGDLQIPFRSYVFFDDGSVVINPRDIMKTGKWKLDEKTKHISIVLEDGSTKDAQVNAIGVKSLLLKAGGNKPEKYVADGKKHSVLLDDPFYPANNTWRKKPAHSVHSVPGGWANWHRSTPPPATAANDSLLPSSAFSNSASFCSKVRF